MTEFLDIGDLAKKFNIPKRSAYQLAQEGKIPGAFKVGRHWRFRRDMVEAWVEEATKPKVTK